MNTPQQSEFRDVLQSLETSLETPRVSGELERWIAAVQKIVESMGRLLPGQIERHHAARLRQIAAEDPGLNAEVARLRTGDDETREQFDNLRERVNRLATRATKVEPDESRLEQELVALTALGLDFVIHARKQEVAIDAWQQEALYRDTGGSG
jgi:chromosome segregation ATPase